MRHQWTLSDSFLYHFSFFVSTGRLRSNQKRFIIFGSACWQPVISMTYVANLQGSVWRAKSVRVDLFLGTVPETGITRASIFLAHSPLNLPTSLLFQSSIRQFSRLLLVGTGDVIARSVCILGNL